MDTKTYQFNKKEFRWRLFFYIIFSPLLYLFLIFYFSKGDITISKTTLMMISPFLLLVLFYMDIYPTLLLLNHYSYDSKTKIIFCEQTRIFYYENEEYSIHFEEQEIDCIYTFFHVKMLVFYHEILFKNGFSLFISDLVLPDTMKKKFSVEHIRESIIFPKFLSQEMNTILFVKPNSSKSAIDQTKSIT